MEKKGMMKRREIAYHRNGVSGIPFHVLTFTDEDGSRKIAIAFGAENGTGVDLDFPAVAVFDFDKLAAGEIGFGVNSWRGDRYAPFVKREIDKHNAEEESRWSR